MDDFDLIKSLMKENTDALGFIPDTTIRDRYLVQGNYIIQTDERGNKIGYLLHGVPTPGGLLTVAQHCIIFEKRDKDYGTQTWLELLERAKQVNARGIKLRCAEDLPANFFWKEKLELVNKVTPTNRRDRAINIYLLDLWPKLF